MFDVAIIGGGVVGANIFCFLQRRGIKTVLLEKNADVGNVTTKANSGIIHAGFDAKPNTKKAKFNVQGNKLMERLTSELDLPYEKIGALVVGNDKEKIEDLYNRGLTNGVKDLEIIGYERLHTLEPNLNPEIKYGLYAKTSGIISPYMFTIALCEEGILNGGVVYRNFETVAIQKVKNYFKINSSFGTSLCAKKIVNCAGANYNKIADLLNTERYPIEYRLGEYYLLDNSEYNIVSHTIFPLPSENSKGVLITPTIDGNILVGPTAIDSDTVPVTTIEGLEYIKQKALKLIPNLNLRKTIRVFAGVRTISGDDFIIEKSNLQDNVINICGICSPGLSSSPGIALDVIKKLGYGDIKVKNFIHRKNIISIKNKSKAELNKLIKKDIDYGQIICKCEMVSKAEIKQALCSPLPALSVDGVKRRVRAGMGRCQGGFCLSKVIEEIAKEHKLPLTEVTKENINSQIFISRIRPQRKVKHGE